MPKKPLPAISEAFATEFPTGDRFKVFQNLMRHRIRLILLVSSPYNLFLFEEDGRVYELLRREYFDLGLSFSPEIVRVSGSREAIETLKQNPSFDLVITTAHSVGEEVRQFADELKKVRTGIPLVHLVFDNAEFNPRLESQSLNPFNGIFTWGGDFRIIIAIIKSVEDALNVEEDVRMAGVQIILLVEDNIRFYSSYLPLLYTELLHQSQKLIPDGINLYHKYLRMRARPKVLLATNYEDACKIVDKYKDNLLGVISDINYMREGKRDPMAGIALTRYIRNIHSDIPILLQSHDVENEQPAHEAGASFLKKDDPHLLKDLRRFVNDELGFGDFVFRTSDGKEIQRAHDLVSLKETLKKIPADVLKYHADRNHFSNWLKARREFWLAYHLKSRTTTDYPNLESLRQDLISALELYFSFQRRGVLSDFDRNNFDPEYGFARIGEGSIGGKARGLSFLNQLINSSELHARFKNIKIRVPAALILGTDVFDAFMEENNLFQEVLDKEDEAHIQDLFLKAHFPESYSRDLKHFLEIVKKPLAIRSSSLLEDSQYFPFAGIYDTVMLPNVEDGIHDRLENLILGIKIVFASTYSKKARTYMRHTSFRLEEEKMAVIIQTLVGKNHNGRFYPELSGVAKSYNHYSIPPQKSEDGLASVVLGLGRMVVEGGNSVNFCPRFPQYIHQFSSIEQTLQNNQTRFFALPLYSDKDLDFRHPDKMLESYDLKTAEKDGSLKYIASTYSPENRAIYDGISRQGYRLITLAPILKYNLFPLASMLETILKLGKEGMGNDVELEFAIQLSEKPSEPHTFALLQMRPIASSAMHYKIKRPEKSKIICYSDQVLGNGRIEKIEDIICVHPGMFDRSHTREIAQEVAWFNQQFFEQQKKYMLITLGRLGSRDPWLGVPVQWEDISEARVIVESGIEEMVIEPSQASHFFHNISFFRVGYFTVTPNKSSHMLNWDWIDRQEIVKKLNYVCHIRVTEKLIAEMDGANNEGIIRLK